MTIRTAVLILFGSLTFTSFNEAQAACGIDYSDGFSGKMSTGVVNIAYALPSLSGKEEKIPLLIRTTVTEGGQLQFSKLTAPMLTAKAVMLDDKTWVFTTPDGNEVRLKKGAQDKQQWRFEEKGKTLILHAPCGSRMTYKGGKINSIADTSGNTIDFIYEGLRTEVKQGKQDWFSFVESKEYIEITGKKASYRLSRDGLSKLKPSGHEAVISLSQHGDEMKLHNSLKELTATWSVATGEVRSINNKAYRHQVIDEAHFFIIDEADGRFSVEPMDKGGRHKALYSRNSTKILVAEYNALDKPRVVKAYDRQFALISTTTIAYNEYGEMIRATQTFEDDRPALQQYFNDPESLK